MPTSLIHRLGIAAPAETIYRTPSGWFNIQTALRSENRTIKL